MTHLPNLLDRLAAWPVIAALLLGAVGMDGFFNLIDQPGSVQHVVALSHPTTDLLDTRFHYDAVQVQAALNAYGTEGRVAYRQFQTWDFGFMGLYGVGLMLLLHRLLRGTTGMGRWLPLLPLAVALADLSENLLLAPLLIEGAVVSPGLSELAGWVTTIKWVLAGAILASLLGTVGWWMRRRG